MAEQLGTTHHELPIGDREALSVIGDLATIYDDGPVSRAEVARITGLTRTTVSYMDALGDALLGRIPFAGSLPVKLDAPRDANRGMGDWRSAR